MNHKYRITNNTLVKIDGNYYIILYMRGTGNIEDVFHFELYRVENRKGIRVEPNVLHTRYKLEDRIDNGIMVLLDSDDPIYREYEIEKRRR